MARTATAGFAADLAYTDPGDVPAHRIGTVVGTTGDTGGGTVTVNTDAGRFTCLVVTGPHSYQVADVEPVQ